VQRLPTAFLHPAEQKMLLILAKAGLIFIAGHVVFVGLAAALYFVG